MRERARAYANWLKLIIFLVQRSPLPSVLALSLSHSVVVVARRLLLTLLLLLSSEDGERRRVHASAAKVPGSRAKTPSYYFYDPETSAGITIISPRALRSRALAVASFSQIESYGQERGGSARLLAGRQRLGQYFQSRRFLLMLP